MAVRSEAPEIGKESFAPNEANDTHKIINTIIKRLKRDYPPGTALRQFHAKMHGCLKATFTVLPDIQENYQYGFLVPGKSYDAWIRFSNGNTTVKDDRKGDLRGMAIKLLNVEGEMLMHDCSLPGSQDFLLVSYPTLMSPDVASFKKNIHAICSGVPGMLAFALNPANWATLLRTLKSMKKCEDVLATKYYSVTPSRLGTPSQAVKYAAFPSLQGAEITVEKEPNFLRHQMQKRLASNTVTFNFMIQLQEDAVRMPIENPVKEWKSAWHKVAHIDIHPQTFDTPERNSFAENLTFSPWHCHKDNRPLGGINRARKAAYEAIGKFRVERNMQSIK